MLVGYNNDLYHQPSQFKIGKSLLIRETTRAASSATHQKAEL